MTGARAGSSSRDRGAPRVARGEAWGQCGAGAGVCSAPCAVPSWRRRRALGSPSLQGPPVLLRLQASIPPSCPHTLRVMVSHNLG